MGQILMIYVDSWVWIEFFIEGKKKKEADKILTMIEHGRSAAISAFVLTEVRHKLAQISGLDVAEDITRLIRQFRHLKILPVSEAVGILAADLKVKYRKLSKKFSVADSIHLATAILAGCNKFYTGNRDFDIVGEVQVVVL